MKRHIQAIGLLAFTLLVVVSCGRSPVDMRHSTGDLSVTVSISKSLYDGEIIADAAGRYVGPTSSSVSLSFTAGGETYSSSSSLSLTGEGNTLSGTAVLEGLPLGVEGIVEVSTRDAGGALICDGSQNLILAERNNEASITLGISRESPYLKVGAAGEYMDEILQPGELSFIELQNLTPGAVYEMYIYQLPGESTEAPVMGAVTKAGEILTFTPIIEAEEYGGMRFTIPTDEDTAILVFYNQHGIQVPGLLWIDRPGAYSSAAFNTTYNSYIWLNGDPEYTSIEAAAGKVFMIDQGNSSSGADYGGIFVSTDNGVNWNLNIPLYANIAGGGLTVNESGRATDLYLHNDLLYAAVYLYDSLAYQNKLGVAAIDPSTENVVTTYSEWEVQNTMNTGYIENFKVAASDEAVFLAYLTGSGQLELYAGSSLSGPNLGTLTVPAVSSSASTTNELQVEAIGTDLYIYADAAVYRWPAGASNLETLYTVEEGTAANYRYLSKFKNRYIASGNGLNGTLYHPEAGKAFPLVTYSEIISQIDPSTQTIYQMCEVSENYYVFVTLVRTISPYALDYFQIEILDNGGYRTVASLPIPTGDFPTDNSFEPYVPLEIVIDEDTGTVYLCGIHSPEGYAGIIYSFELN